LNSRSAAVSLKSFTFSQAISIFWRSASAAAFAWRASSSRRCAASRSSFCRSASLAAFARFFLVLAPLRGLAFRLLPLRLCPVALRLGRGLGALLLVLAPLHGLPFRPLARGFGGNFRALLGFFAPLRGLAFNALDPTLRVRDARR
jgi:hypothetical protein